MFYGAAGIAHILNVTVYCVELKYSSDSVLGCLTKGLIEPVRMTFFRVSTPHSFYIVCLCV